MDGDERYSIPVPARFRCAPLVRLPWGVAELPQLLRGAGRAEAALADQLRRGYGVRHCLLTDSARSAWALYLQATAAGGEILMPSLMYTPLTVLLVNCGLTPAFCDVETDFCVSVRTLDAAAATTTKAVLVQHMFGQMAPADKIWEWARGRGIKVLANLVQVPPFVEVKGRLPGAYCDAGFVSFGWDKPLHGIYGGALLTNSDEVFEKASRQRLRSTPAVRVARQLVKALALYRWKPCFSPAHWLLSSMRHAYLEHDEVEHFYEEYPDDAYRDYVPGGIHRWQAAAAAALMERSPDLVAGRRERAAHACRLLAGLPEVSVLEDREYPSTYLYFPIVLDPAVSRYRLGVALARRGVESKWRYYPLHRLRKFAGFRAAALDNTEDLWRRYLLLPVPCASPADVERVAAAVTESVAEVKSGRYRSGAQDPEER